MSELPKSLILCPDWQKHDDIDGPCPRCNGRGVLLPDGSPVPDDIVLWVDKFEPANLAEGESPTATITILPTGIDDEDTQSQGK